MPFWIFKKRDDTTERVDRMESSLKDSFSHIKKDIQEINKTQNNFHGHHKHHYDNITSIHEKLEDIYQRINTLETSINTAKQEGLFVQTAVVNGQTQTDTRLQQGVEPVQTRVQTDEFTKRLTPMERAIISVLLNTDLKLTYEDLSVALGRDKSTIRGQVNNIKQKRENLVKEVIETNGKKRFYIDEETKTQVFKQRNSLKVRLREKKARDQE